MNKDAALIRACIQHFYGRVENPQQLINKLTALADRLEAQESKAEEIMTYCCPNPKKDGWPCGNVWPMSFGSTCPKCKRDVPEYVPFPKPQVEEIARLPDGTMRFEKAITTLGAKINEHTAAINSIRKGE